MGGSARAWVDGGSRGNPGPAGFGVLIESAAGSQEIRGYLGHATNNVAEYSGLLAALSFAVEHGLTELAVSSDSELLVKQLKGLYRVKAAHLVPYFERARQLVRAVPKFSIRHVPRAENARADALANEAIDQRSPLPAWLVLPGGARA